MKKISLGASVIFTSFVSFVSVYAAPDMGYTTQTTQTAATNVGSLFSIFQELVNKSIGLLVTVALAVFFYGLVIYIFKLGGESAEQTAKSKHLMLYGILALFVMTSVWGLVGWLGGAVGINQNVGANVGNLVPLR